MQHWASHGRNGKSWWQFLCSLHGCGREQLVTTQGQKSLLKSFPPAPSTQQTPFLVATGALGEFLGLGGFLCSRRVKRISSWFALEEQRPLQSTLGHKTQEEQ